MSNKYFFQLRKILEKASWFWDLHPIFARTPGHNRSIRCYVRAFQGKEGAQPSCRWRTLQQLRRCSATAIPSSTAIQSRTAIPSSTATEPPSRRQLRAVQGPQQLQPAWIPHGLEVIMLGSELHMKLVLCCTEARIRC